MAAQGHILDADTFALWRMDETAAGTHATIVDSVSAYNLATTGDPKVVNGPHESRYARHFNGAQKATRVGHANAVTALLADVTVQAKIRLDVGGVDQYILAYGTGLTDGTAANNHLLGFYVSTTNRIASFSESGGGVNANVVSAGAALTVGTWYDVAMVRTISGANQLIEFFVNGVSQGAAQSAVKPSGGTAATWSLGESAAGAVQYFNGAIGAVHVSKVARSGAYVLADAVRTDGKYTSDANSLTYWGMAADTPDAIDAGPNGIHLTATASAQLTHGADGLIADGGYSKFFSATGCELSSARPPSAEAAALRTAMLGSWTWEAWVRMGDLNAVRRWLFTWGGPGVSDVLADNYIGADIDGSRTFATYTEHGAGVDEQFTVATYCTAAQIFSRQHVAVRLTLGVSTYVMDVFRNGVKVGTSTARTPHDGGTNNYMRIASLSSGNGWYGMMDDVRLSDIARTDAEILDSYERGAADSEPPSIEVIEPATTVSPDSVIVLEVTDDTALAVVAILAKITDRTTGDLLFDEPVHDGFAFRKMYQNTTYNKRTAIDGGYELRIMRDGGWPGNVQFEYIVRDTSSNEGVVV